MSLRIKTLSLTAMVAAIAAVCTAPAAQAESASTMCAKSISTSYGQGYKCPMWHSAPVRTNADPSGAQIGSLPSGSANLFLYQCIGAPLYTLGYVNNHWGLGQATNGKWGYVNEVYFSGGGNWEADGGLPVTRWSSYGYC